MIPFAPSDDVCPLLEERHTKMAQKVEHCRLLFCIQLQKLRKRAHGVNAATLASGKKVTKVDELVHNDPDPFKLKTGGMLTLDQAKKAAKEQEKAEAGEEEEIIGTQFSKETRVRFVNFLYFIHLSNEAKVNETIFSSNF